VAKQTSAPLARPAKDQHRTSIGLVAIKPIKDLFQSGQHGEGWTLFHAGPAGFGAVVSQPGHRQGVQRRIRVERQRNTTIQQFGGGQGQK